MTWIKTVVRLSTSYMSFIGFFYTLNIEITYGVTVKSMSSVRKLILEIKMNSEYVFESRFLGLVFPSLNQGQFIHGQIVT